MNAAKTAVVGISVVVIAVAVADLGWGNTQTPVLPSFIGDLLTQNTDLFLMLASVAAIFLSVNYL